MEKRLPLPVGTVLQGRYRIMRQLGHGGMGAVYEAVDDEISLSFALKETFYADEEELRQAFRREARMLASLSHEAFPRVSHYFTEGDGCFLVMELIRGDDLDKLLEKRGAPFEPEQVLTWADQILDALEDLHTSGIVHRDIKPSNLKLTPKGKIKLLDFGIAKGALEGETTLLTTVGSMAAATLQYAPLEQVLRASPQYQMMLSVVSSDNVTEIMRRGTDATSDLYALAATLYHLLTKTLPADAPTRALAIWSGQNDRLIPAHAANAQVSKEVSDVLKKAMKLDRAERPSSAAELRQMLKEAVKPTPVIEPAPTVPLPSVNDFEEQVTELITKPSPRPFTAEPLKTIPAQKVPTAPDLLPPADKPLKNSLRSLAMFGLPALLVLVTIIAALVYFNQTPGITANINTNRASSNSASNTNLAFGSGNSNKYEFVKTLAVHDETFSAVAFSPDGKTMAGGSYQKIMLFDAANGELKQTLTGFGGYVSSAAFSPDGKTLAVSSYDETIKLWDVTGSTLKQTLTGHTDSVSTVAFSPDGKTLVSAGGTSGMSKFDSTIKLWDAASGALKQTLKGHTDALTDVAFSPNGDTIVSGSYDKTVKVWDATTGTLKQTLTGHNTMVTEVAFSPDGKTVASGGKDAKIILWDVVSGNRKEITTGYSNGITDLKFSPDGRIIAGGGFADDIIKLWDAISGELKQTLTGHTGYPSDIAFSPDGKTIASGASDKTVKLWRIE